MIRMTNEQLSYQKLKVENAYAEETKSISRLRSVNLSKLLKYNKMN